MSISTSKPPSSSRSIGVVAGAVEDGVLFVAILVTLENPFPVRSVVTKNGGSIGIVARVRSLVASVASVMPIGGLTEAVHTGMGLAVANENEAFFEPPPKALGPKPSNIRSIK